MASKSLEERIARIESYIEIQNLMSRYAYVHAAGLEEETVALFAQKVPDVSVEISNWGVYTGIEGVKRCYIGLHNFIEGDRVGFLVEHDMTTPAIEVAGDNKTAQGVWMSPGFETQKNKEGKLASNWCWGKYEVDFIKEDGQWKFWHFKRYGVINTPYYQSWADIDRDPGPFPSKEYPPDLPSTYYHPYTKTTRPELAPAPPEPYETYNKNFPSIPTK